MTAIPDDALDREVLVKMTLRELVEWQSAKDAEPFDPVGTPEAADIMDISERKARRLAAKCERQQNAGRKPEVRVRRKGSSPQSDIEYHRADCWSYRRAHGGGPRVSGGVKDEADLIVDALLAEG